MWGNAKTIFLSYRRDDVPGYVRQLQEDLQQNFGDCSVFRDVEDIAGGQYWKEVLANNLAQSAALIVIIGPRWEQIWNERADKSNDYIVYELNKARKLGVAVIPVTINGAEISNGLDLGPISWLREKQHYDISDKQGRWPTDVSGLVSILEREKGLKKIKQKSSGNSRKLLTASMIVAILAVLGFLANPGYDEPYTPDTELTPTAAMPNLQAENFTDDVANVQTALVQGLSAVSAFPPIAGYWYDEEGAVYLISDVTDDYFFVSEVNLLEDGSHASGEGALFGVAQIIPDMPRKFTLQVDGFGHGEYSISAGDKKMMGWFYINATAETLYGTLRRLEDGA